MPSDNKLTAHIAMLIHHTTEHLKPFIQKRCAMQNIATLNRSPYPNESPLWTHATEVWAQAINPTPNPSNPAPFLFAHIITFGFSDAMITKEATPEEIENAAKIMAETIIRGFEQLYPTPATPEAQPKCTCATTPTEPEPDLLALRERRLRR